MKPEPAIVPQDIINGLRAIRNRHYLVSIHPTDGPQNAHEFDLSDPMQEDFCTLWIEQEQDCGRNIYFHANPVVPGFKGLKASKADIAECTHAQLDLDPDSDNSRPYQDRRDEVKHKMRFIEKDYPPTVVIDSGNGFNMLWELKQPLDVNGYETQNRAFNYFYNAKGTYNADRILKVPGTVAYSSPVKVTKGYPVERQARLVKASIGRTTSYDVLPAAQGTGNQTTTAKGSTIPLPTAISQTETDRLRDIIKNTEELRNALKPGAYSDRSAGAVAVAGACIRANLDRLDYATVIVLADKSDAHAHIMDQENPDRALGRAWDQASGRKAKEEFGTIDGEQAVPPPKPKTKPEDFDAGDLILDGQDALASMTPPAKRIYVEDFNIEGVRVLIGQPKMGKSWLIMQEAQAVAQGNPDFLGMPVKRGRVLYCGFEDGANRLHHRINALGYDKNPCPDIKYWHDPEETAAGNLAKMIAIHNQFPFDVMYIDTMKWWLGSSGARFGTAYDQSVEDLKPLIQFANAKGVSLTLTTHMKKDKRGTEDWMDLVQGSIGSLATASSAVMLDRRRGEDDALLHRTGRDFIDDDDIAVQWQGMPMGWNLSPYSAASMNARNQLKRGGMPDRIVSILQQNPPMVSKDGLKKQVGGDQSNTKGNFYRALRDLENKGTIGYDDDNVWLQ